VGLLNLTLDRVAEAELIEKSVAHFHKNSGASLSDDSSIKDAWRGGAINEIEGAKLLEYRRLVRAVIAVDEFAATAGGAQNSAHKR